MIESDVKVCFIFVNTSMRQMTWLGVNHDKSTGIITLCFRLFFPIYRLKEYQIFALLARGVNRRRHFDFIPTRKMNIKTDPEFKVLVPPLSSEEYSQLEGNLKKETNPDSIILTTWDGTLIDGHHRYEICQKHNISFRTVEKEFADRDDVKIWIIQNQFGRRNINNYVRSKLALELEELFQKKALQNKQFASRQSIKVLNQVPQISAKPELKEIKPVDTRQELA